MPPRGIVVAAATTSSARRDGDSEDDDTSAADDTQLASSSAATTTTATTSSPPSSSGSSTKRSRLEIVGQLHASPSSSSSSSSSSSTSADDLEVCERCKREGEVLECDVTGCEMLWHVECVPELRGRVPSGRWQCPGPHREVCEVCLLPGEVVICDVPKCGRVYHVRCLPALRGQVPKGFWECPGCVSEREAGLICSVCLKAQLDNDHLMKCVSCKGAVHLGCIGGYGTRGHVTCAACNFADIARPKRSKQAELQVVRIEFAPNLSIVDQARIIQIAKGEATGLTDEEARAFLNAGIAMRRRNSAASMSSGSA